jgi:pimeloyl-ACP methyl ester carboxylesterase
MPTTTGTSDFAFCLCILLDCPFPLPPPQSSETRRLFPATPPFVPVSLRFSEYNQSSGCAIKRIRCWSGVLHLSDSPCLFGTFNEQHRLFILSFIRMDHRRVGDFRKFAVETLSTVLDALELESVPIVAHSMGGHWSLWLALDRPERVTALTLLGVPGNLISTGPPFALRLLSVPGLNRLLFGIIMLAIKRQPSETSTSVSAAMAACRYHSQRLPHYRISTLSLMERTNRLRGPRPEHTLSAEQLKRVQQPTMFLWGTNDPFGSSEIGRHIAQILPSSEFHAIQGAGHLPWLSNLAECGQLTRDFLANHASPATDRDLSPQ